MAASTNSTLDEPSEIVIKDPLCDFGLNASWGLGKQLYVYAGKSQHRESKGCQGNVSVHEVCWDIEMSTPITRKLANESRNLFILLQQKAEELDRASLRPHLLKASRNYRAVLKACCLSLAESAMETCDMFEKQECENQVQLYEMVDLIWSLCELLFIHECSNGIILGQLLDWLRWSFPETDTQEVCQHEPPELHPHYWNAVHRLVLQGRIDTARQLLSQHSQRNQTPFISINHLLSKIPLPMLFRGHTTLEVEMKWRLWQRECKSRIDDGDFSTNIDVEAIAMILVGDDGVFSQLSDLCESWYQMLVSKMLYQNPTVKAHELHHNVQTCIECYGGSSKLGHLDHIILAALEFDVHLVIKDCSHHFGSWWFVTHLTDLFYHNGWAGSRQVEYGSTLREHLLLEYASTLMSHHSMWQIGVDYLDHCPQYGRRYLEMYIERVPLTSDKKAHKVIHVCEVRGMTDQVRSMCKVMARSCLQARRLGSALTWCLKSKDVAFTTMITERFLEEYMYHGEFSHLDLLDHLGPSMLLSKKLTFFGKYREFHKLYEEGEFSEAASLLLSLLVSRLIPNQFLVTVLTDALPLLETDKPVLSVSQTYELMYCLENMTATQQHASSLHHKAFSDQEKERLGLLRLALARNLARVILQEQSTQP